MRLPDHVVRRAVAKKRKATNDAEGLRKWPRSRSPARSSTQSLTLAPLTHQPREDREPILAIDLIADTPLEGRKIEVTPPPMEPTSLGTEMTCSGAEPALVEGSPVGEQAREEGPMVVGPSAGERPSASGAAPAASDPAGTTEGGGAGLYLPDPPL